jgi:CRP-like cAMP-binding protein
MHSDNNLNIKLSFLKAQPCFHIFDENELIPLTNVMEKRVVSKGQTIVTEGEVVSDVFIIESGMAEVEKKHIHNNQIIQEPIASLKKYDSIGLSKTGYWSSTGMRSATVRAVEDMIVYAISTNALSKFFFQHPEHESLVFEHLDLIYRMNFIKQAAVFTHLEPQELYHFSKKLESFQLNENEYLFQKGDSGSDCFLLEKGSLEVYDIHEGGCEYLVGSVEPGEIVGESAVLFDTIRETSAKAVVPSLLLRFDAELFNEITGVNQAAKEAMHYLHEVRKRPRKIQEVETYENVDSSGDYVFILKNPNTNSYFQTAHAGKAVWEKIDGVRSLYDLTIEYYKEFGELNYSRLSTFVMALHLANMVNLDLKISKEQHVEWVWKILYWIKKILTFKVCYPHVDKFIQITYDKFVYLLFRKLSIIFLSLISLIGLFIFLFLSPSVVESLKMDPKNFVYYMTGIFLLSFTLPFHELAHGYTTKFYGRKVHSFGIGWLWTSPFAFCDTSDMWLNPWKERLVVDLAGIFLNIILAGFAGILMLFFNENTIIQITIWSFVFNTYLLSVFSNLNPAIDLDGYYVLMDWFDKPNLRKETVLWIKSIFLKKEKFFSKNTLTVYKHQFLYLILTFIYEVVRLFICLALVLFFFLKVFKIQEIWFSVVLALVVSFLSLLSTYAEIKKNI